MGCDQEVCNARVVDMYKEARQNSQTKNHQRLTRNQEYQLIATKKAAMQTL